VVFLVLAATAGRTTLNGEGFTDEDGHSHIQAGLIPILHILRLPTYSLRSGFIVQDGLRRM